MQVQADYWEMYPLKSDNIILILLQETRTGQNKEKMAGTQSHHSIHLIKEGQDKSTNVVECGYGKFKRPQKGEDHELPRAIIPLFSI